MNAKVETPTPKEPPKKEQHLIEFEKNLSDSVMNRVVVLSKEGRLNLPANYSVGNALAVAWLRILATVDKNRAPALTVCTKDSIFYSLLDMTIMGLNVNKDQGYFIVYGNELNFMASYFGKCAVVKRLKEVENEPIATLIYEGDKVELGHNELKEELVVVHETSWENKLKGTITGVYATVKVRGINRSAVMTMAEIKEAWNAQKLIEPSRRQVDHENFAGEFCKKTVIHRLTKMIINTSNDDDLLAETLMLNDHRHFDFEAEVISAAEEKAKLEVGKQANQGPVIGILSPEKKKTLEAEDAPENSGPAIVNEAKPEPVSIPVEAPAPKPKASTRGF